MLNRIDMKEFISQLLKERAQWAKVYGLESSRTVYNPLILHHIRGYKQGKVTVIYGSPLSQQVLDVAKASTAKIVREHRKRLKDYSEQLTQVYKGIK